MSVGSRLEGAALAVAGLAVVAFVVSAGVGLRFPHGTVASARDLAVPDSVPVPGSGVVNAPRVEVLNGTARDGLARDATERLRAAGLDVVYFGNAPEPRGLSVVLDRGGRADAARRVAAVLGIRDVRSRPNATLYVDVTVVLGKDWPPPAKPASESRTERAWQAVRSVF